MTSASPREHRHELLTGSWSFEALGFTAGALGALAVALFFLVVDVLAGHPLWTPTALGSALFLGKHLARDSPITRSCWATPRSISVSSPGSER